MAKEMLINVSEGEECRIAIVEDGVLEELYMERQSSTSHVNNIYKGRVMNVEASIQAAFVDFGLGRNGFLHISDLMPTYFGRRGEEVEEAVGRKMARRDRPPIQRCLRRGDEIIVQVIKEGIGTKGPTLNSYISIPGKYLVMMPGMVSKGVSRNITDEDERRRLRQIIDQLDPPDDCGFIIRTAGVGKSKAEFERDLKYLSRLWETIKKKRDNEPAPVELYTEGDLVTRTVRDLFTADVDSIVIDNKEVARRVKEVIKLSNPRTKNRVDLYEDPIPLFHKYGIEREIEQMYSRHVPLKSGGSLVIDSTEAIVAIDVNSGKFRDHSDAETTAFKIDLEAADEICRQLKLRDLGGVIICDFIDLRFERHRRELNQRLHDNLKNDRAKTKVLPMSQFGIIEMTRQRMRPSLKRSVYFDCPHCKGAGLVKTPESMGLDVMRRLAIAVHDDRVARVELSVNSDVSYYLLNKKRSALSQLEEQAGKRIVVGTDASLGLDEMRLSLFDNRDGVVIIEELANIGQTVPHKNQLNTRSAQQQQRGRQGGRGRDRDQRGRGRQEPQGRGGRNDEPRDDYDREFDAAEDREAEDFDDQAESTHEAAEGSEQEERQDRGQQPRHGGRQERGGGGQRDQRNNAQGGQRGEGSYDDHRQGSEQQEGEGGKRRRRRRRRRRGRGGRGGQFQDGQNAGQGERSGGDFDSRDRDYDDRESRPSDENGQDYSDESADAEGRSDRYAEDERDESVAHRDDNRHRKDESFARDERDSDYDREEDLAAGNEDESSREASISFGDRDENLPWESDRTDSEFASESETTRETADDSGEESATAKDDAAEPTSSDEPEPEPQAPKRGKGRGKSAGASRGRGRKKAEAAESSAESSEAAPSEDAEEKPKRRRGGSAAKKPSRSRSGKAEAESQASSAPAASASTPAPASTPFIKSGSTDKHLNDEEPVHHEPVRRPRSYRDLDAIPDDYD